MITVRSATTDNEIEIIRTLFAEYQSHIGVDLSFQHFDLELSLLPGEYSSPDGCLLLAYTNDEVVGCVAVRKMSDDICELKRMYARPDFRGLGIGRQLALVAIELARRTGYHRMRLDTLSSMTAAIMLYQSLGFTSIPPYRHNPIPGALFMELELS